jgi:FkbM family methyltransferase
MSSNIAKFIKQQLKRIPIRITKNQQYDYLTKKIIREKLSVDSNCIDVGCFEGEILNLFIKSAPNGKHYAFEPIPGKYEKLVLKYQNVQTVCIQNLALSNEEGRSAFNYVKSNPSYSGLKKRDYDRTNEIDEKIMVRTDLLDHCVPQNAKIDLIKIDVEGAEYLVLEGARETILKWKPLIIFEHGLGASDKYGYGPAELFQLLASWGMIISNLDAYLKGEASLLPEEFSRQYLEKLNHYFIAHAKLSNR